MSETCRRTRHARQGQAAVEMAIAFGGFVLLVFGLIDAARGIYTVQGLTRAAEAIAHQTTLVFNATYTGTGAPGITSQSLIYSTVSGMKAPFTFGSAASPIGFDTSEPTVSANQPGYQELANHNVYVCAAPSLATPWVVKVTVVNQFVPITTYLVGGRHLTLSRSATALTSLGERSGTPAAVLQTICPSH